jgi:hypothetical protein
MKFYEYQGRKRPYIHSKREKRERDWLLKDTVKKITNQTFCEK